MNGGFGGGGLAQPFGASYQPPASGLGQQPITTTTPTMRDVLNGRGQGVQRHPGNVKYRTLVFVNKIIYAKCPRTDKMKISKGIVAAVRELGGRFLELEERSGIYRDIGDKKATEKTSQALREGQTKIRKQMYKDEETSGNPTQDTTLLDWTRKGDKSAEGYHGYTMPSLQEKSADGYFGYSVQVLDLLYAQEENRGGPPQGGGPTAARSHPLPQQTISAAPVAPAAPFGSGNSAAMAMAMDQFPGAVQDPPPLPPPDRRASQQAMPPPQAVDPSRPSMGRFTDASFRITEDGRPSLRLTNMSMGSMFSINSVRQLLESARVEYPGLGGDRGSIQSVLSSEIRDLIRFSEPQLVAIDNNMAMDDTPTSHEDKEVVFDEDTMKDRVSELRFTDLGRDSPKRSSNEPNPRRTDSSESTSYSKQSLMDASMMTFEEDMTISHGDTKGSQQEKPSGAKKGSDQGDVASAELLLGLSTDKHGPTNISEV